MKIRLRGKRVGPYWVYPRGEIDDTINISLIIQIGTRSKQLPNISSDQISVAVRDAKGTPAEYLSRPEPEYLPVHGGPSLQATADFVLTRLESDPKTLDVIIADESTTFDFFDDDEEEPPGGQKVPTPGTPWPPIITPSPTPGPAPGPAPAPAPLPQPAPPKPKNWLLAILIAVVLFLLGVYLYRYLKKRKRKGKNCCLKMFDAPANRSVTKNPTQLTESFEMKAEFNGAPDPCLCPCCEYRQYVRGKFTLNGKKQKHALPDGDLHETDYREDGIPNEHGADMHGYYGHRDDNPQTDNDKYSPNRADGCVYFGWDEPGWNSTKPNVPCTVELEFIGLIIDTCKGEVTDVKQWTVNLTRP
ncbi:MAG: FeoB-associated Cys-rich membrane protein [Pyrinomonadaceae bacterium]